MLNTRLYTLGGGFAAVEWKRYKAECLVKALEARLEHLEPVSFYKDFDFIMGQLENAQQALATAEQEAQRMEAMANWP